MKLNPWLALIASVAIVSALWNLRAASLGLEIKPVSIDGTPATIFRKTGGRPAPVVVIAHGFAGSQQLMQSFALTLAHDGYIAVTFDFPGHGRNPKPLTGSITQANGATRTLVAEIAKVAAFARPLGDGRLAALGHSMASDIVVRYAQETPDVAASIAVSMFSPAVTAGTPPNLLVIVGDWEGMLKTEALRAIGLATAPDAPQPGVTYGDLAKGTGRRAAFSPHVEHASVLYSEASMREAVRWLDQTFAIPRVEPPYLDGRGPWILLLVAGVVLLARPLCALLPRLAAPPLGAGLGWGRVWLPLLLPMITTPLLLRLAPTHFLPVLVADYLAVHFAAYGALTAMCLAFLGKWAWPKAMAVPSVLGAALAVVAYVFIALFWPIDTFVTSFFPGPERIALVLAMLVGTLAFFLADEWMTRGAGAGRGAYAASKLAFLASLGIAVALDFERLFFLIIIIPIILLFFLVFGLFSSWIYRRAGQPLVAALANAFAFAWAIGVTFPLLAA